MLLDLVIKYVINVLLVLFLHKQDLVDVVIVLQEHMLLKVHIHV
jgi:hypothetical protein